MGTYAWIFKSLSCHISRVNLRGNNVNSSLSITLLTTLLALSGVLLGGCGDDSDRRPARQPEPVPTALEISPPRVEAAPDAEHITLLGTNFPLSEVGYRQREYFLEGSASAFSALNELGRDGHWDVEPGEQADYRTRVVVYRPIDAAEFSGTVIVEWLNVSAGFESAAVWYSAHTEALRRGHAWVFVSAQFVGIEGSESALLPFHLKAANPGRYGDLLHPGDSFSYDLFSQVARAVRDSANEGILDGLRAERLFAVGESQSAHRLVTYINAVHPLYRPYDGYLVYSRLGGAAALAQAPQVMETASSAVTIREDLDVPVLTYQTESDLLLLGYAGSRQPDGDLFRLWEVAGTAHADLYSSTTGRDDTGVDPAFAVVVEQDSIEGGLLQCAQPINSGHMVWTLNAAMRALENWVRRGTAPPQAERIALSDDGGAILRDEYGNALGGVRTPYLEAPAATLSGEGQTGTSFCGLFGTTRLFDAATMASLYVDRAGYRAAVAEATDAAVEAGFILPDDGRRIKAAAGLQWDLLEQ